MTSEPETALTEQNFDGEVPVCISCFSPVDPATNSCDNCGATVGQHTEYVPFVNISWAATGYDRLRQATLPSSGPVSVRILSVMTAFFLAPLLLLAMPFRWLAGRRKTQQP
ncbi:MAG: hypothetical protein ACI9EF_001551 [Pseudohongiellaceae bacterium]|jgi:hypothetical protein